MRPVRRNISPQAKEFSPYTTALAPLVDRIGRYCSYCERPILTQLAVEHIQPKALPAYRHLIGCWSNYLLACVNCNSTKKDKDFLLKEVFLPDRDNTFAAFTYSQDGALDPSPKAISAGLADLANATLALTGLDKITAQSPNPNLRLIALERSGQRRETWLIAQESKRALASQTDNLGLRDAIVRLAQATGFFSVWMTVFSGDSDMLNRLIDAFPGTRESGCFNTNGEVISPAANPDELPFGRKI